MHQSRVSPCPPHFPAGYFWYGSRRHSSGRPPKWVQNLLQSSQESGPSEEESSAEEPDCHEENSHVLSDDSIPVTYDVEPDAESNTDVGAQDLLPETRRGRYSLRRNTRAPDRLMHLCSGRATLKEGVM